MLGRTYVFKRVSSFSFNKYPWVGIAGSGGTVYFHFLWDLRTVFQRPHQFTPPPAAYWTSLFSTPLPAFVICGLFDGSHSDRMAHCGFDFCFLDDEWRWAAFHVPAGHNMPFWEKCLFRSSVHILIRLLLFYIGLYELWPSSPPALNLSPPSGSFPVLILTLFPIGKNWRQIEKNV